MTLPEPDILEELADLHLQATTEKSHHYTASVIRRASAEIMKLREEMRDLIDRWVLGEQGPEDQADGFR